MAKKVVSYVLDEYGVPLMPCRSYGRVRRMVRIGKARIVRAHPLTIQLLARTDADGNQVPVPDRERDRILMGIDPGRTNIGLCAVSEKGEVLYASDVETRNKTVASLMLERKQHRQASRRGRRLKRKRRACHNNTAFCPMKDGVQVCSFRDTGMGKRPDVRSLEWGRILPGCEKPVPIKSIRNKKVRFSNRKRPHGWLTPTANQLLQTHISAVNKVLTLLPVTDIAVELNKFSFARMEDPTLYGQDFCHGPLYGFLGVKDAIAQQQGGHCLFCKKPIDHFHHIVPVSRGGSWTMENAAGLCKGHHEEVHTDAAARKKLKEKKAGLSKKYGALSTLNQIIPYFWEYLQEMEPFVHIHATTGKDTKDLRDQMDLPKEHHVDAWCIAVSALEKTPLAMPEFDVVYHIVQYRRHDRQCAKLHKQRKYILDGKTVAVNRHKAVTAIPVERKDGSQKLDKDGNAIYKEIRQTGDSLEEYRVKLVAKYGETKAQRIISLLKAEKGSICYNNRKRVLPGALMMGPDGKRFVLQGQHNNCTRYIQAEYGHQAQRKVHSYASRQEKTMLDRYELEAARKYATLSVRSDVLKLEEVQAGRCKILAHNCGLVYVEKGTRLQESVYF